MPGPFDVDPMMGDVLPPSTMAAPLPAAPPRMVSQDPRQQLLSIAALGALLGAGPRSGVGVGMGQGLLQGQQHLQTITDAHAAVVRHQQEQIAQAQHQQAVETDQRQRQLQSALMTITQRVKDVPDKETYDQEIAGYASALQGAGYRLDVNWLRKAVPYVAPTSEKRAGKVLEAFFKNPANAQLIKENPDQLVKASVSFDVDGDGIPEQVPILRLSQIAKQPFAVDASGQMLNYNKGTTLDDKANADGIFQTLLSQAKAEGKDTNDPKLRLSLQEQAIQKATADKAREKDPAVAAQQAATLELTNQRLSDLKGRGNGTAGGGLTDDGVEYAATQYRVTGVMPPLGMGSSGARSAIINRAAQQAKTMGQTPAASIQKQAAYKADSTALTQMQKMASSAAAFENKAVAQTDIIADLSRKVPRTQWPVINDAILAGRARIAGDENTQLLFNAITTFSAEYAKIMEGSTGSAAGSSDSARKASDRLISAGLNQRTMKSTLELMKREMALTIDGYGATIDHITSRMGGQPAQSPAAAAPTSDPASDSALQGAISILRNRRGR